MSGSYEYFPTPLRVLFWEECVRAIRSNGIFKDVKPGISEWRRAQDYHRVGYVLGPDLVNDILHHARLSIGVELLDENDIRDSKLREALINQGIPIGREVGRSVVAREGNKGRRVIGLSRRQQIDIGNETSVVLRSVSKRSIVEETVGDYHHHPQPRKKQDEEIAIEDPEETALYDRIAELIGQLGPSAVENFSFAETFLHGQSTGDLILFLNDSNRHVTYVSHQIPPDNPEKERYAIYQILKCETRPEKIPSHKELDIARLTFYVRWLENFVKKGKQFVVQDAISMVASQLEARARSLGLREFRGEVELAPDEVLLYSMFVRDISNWCFW